MESSSQFSETTSAAHLLEEFYSLSRKPGKRYTRSTNPAAARFFGKDFLTIVDFLGPIGEDLMVPVECEEDNSVQSFIASSLHRTKKASPRPERSMTKKHETIAEFLIRLGA